MKALKTILLVLIILSVAPIGFAQPANDDCQNALPLPINALFDCSEEAQSSTLGALPSGKNCAGTSDTPDVWYTFVATSASKRLVIDANPEMLSHDWAFGFELYVGDCSGLQTVFCREDHFGEDTLLGDLIPGNRYYLRLYSRGGSAHNFSLCLQTLPPPPANMDCAHAENMISLAEPNCGPPVLGNNSGVLTPSVGQGACDTQGKALWYRFIAESEVHLVKVQEVKDLLGFGGPFYSVETYEGDSCGGLVLLKCYNNPQDVYFTNLTVGKPYYLRWVGAVTEYQTFQLCLTHLLPAYNDDCANAAMLYYPRPDLNCQTPLAFTTMGATAGSANTCSGGNDVWFNFWAVQTTQHVVLSNILNLEGTELRHLNVELLTGDCGNLRSLRCWDDAFLGNGTLFLGDLVPAQSYYLRFSTPDSTDLWANLCLLTPPKPPVNDACADAIVLSPSVNCNTVEGTTQWASPTLGLPVPHCCGEGDVWYAFTASQANQTVKMSSVYYESSWYPTSVVLELYTASCTDWVLLAKSQGATGSRWPLSHLVPGTTYLLRVYSENHPWAQFKICVSTTTTPANDSCLHAAPLPVNSDVDCSKLAYIFTEGSSQSQPDCSGGAVNDVWYQFTATTSVYRFDTQWLPGGTAGTWGYEILSGDCNGLVSLRCRSSNRLQDTLFERGLEVGKTYFLRFFSEKNQALSMIFCANALGEPPSNDACANALPLSVAPSFACATPQQGSTLAADHSEPACGGPGNHDVWYRFTATHEAHILYLKAEKAYFGDKTLLGYRFFSGVCGQLKPILCRETLSQNAFVLDSLKSGETYWVQVNSREHSAHNFDICVATLPAPPSNDFCEKAYSIPVNQTLHCDLTASGTTLAATAFNEWPNGPDVWYTFTATASTHFFQLLNIQTLWGRPDQLRCQLFLGNSCGSLGFIRYFEPFTQVQVDDLLEGQRYHLRVFTLDSAAAYLFEVCVKSFPPPPANGVCGGALPLTVNKGAVCTASTTGTTAGTVRELDFSSGYFRAFHTVWYRFVATSPSHYVHINNLRAVTGSNSGNFDVSIYRGDSCAALSGGITYVLRSIHLQDLVPGQTFYIACASKGDGFVNTVFHEFDLCVTTDSIPANDSCGGAFYLPVASDLGDAPFTHGTLSGASPGPEGTDWCSAAANDVWYAFIATQSAHTLWINKAQSVPDAEPAHFSTGLYAGNCGQLERLVCRGDLLEKDSVTYGDLTPGKTYFVQLSKYEVAQSDYTFDIRIGTPPAPPANDACLGAFALNISPDTLCTTLVSGSTENATPSAFQEGRVLTGLPDAGDDVWYTFVATHANHWVSLRHNSAEPYPLHIEVYEGRCDSLSKTAAFGAYFPEKEHYLLTNLRIGAGYYLRVFDTAPVGLVFDLCIGIPAVPANDDCAGAVPLLVQSDFTCAQPTATHTFGATQSAPDCSGGAANDVWFRFTAPGSAVRLWSEIERLQREALHGWELFEGDCGALKSVDRCWEANDHDAEIITGLKAGVQYYLRCYTARHNWLLQGICLQKVPEPPANDLCSGAIAVEPNGGLACERVYAGTTLGATQSALDCHENPTHDVWYRFTGDGSTYLTDVKATRFYLGDSTIGIGVQAYRGDDCTALDALGCDYQVGHTWLFLNQLAAGETCYLRVFNLKNKATDFELCIRSLPSPPVHTVCSEAILLEPGFASDCTLGAMVNTANLSEERNGPCLNGTSLWYRFVATEIPYFIEWKNLVNDYGEDHPGLEIYRGTCDGLSLVECHYDGVPFYFNIAVPGETYYIRVVGQIFTGTRFELCLRVPLPPANDDCPHVQTVPVSLGQGCNTRVSGTNLGASPSAGIFCDGGPDVLYAFKAIATEHTINIENVYPDIPLGQTFMEVFSGDSCGAWHTYKGCYQAHYTELKDLTPGQTYYLRIGSYIGTWFNFNLCITTPRPQLSVYEVRLPFQGCKTGSKERIEVVVVQSGNGIVQGGTTEFRLILSGANQGDYGPIFNTHPFYVYPWYAPWPLRVSVPRFEAVDMSALGETHITAIVTYRDGVYTDVDSLTVHYTNHPPYDEYCPPEEVNSPKNTHDRSTEVIRSGLFLSPNPAEAETQVSFQLENATSVRLLVSDAAGHLVQSKQIVGKSGLNQYLLQTDHWPAGIYIVQIQAAGSVCTGRLAVIRR